LPGSLCPDCPELASNLAERIERFPAEARRVARLRHPKIVPVDEDDRQKDVFIIILDLIEGEGLRQRMKGDKLAVREIVTGFLKCHQGFLFVKARRRLNVTKIGSDLSQSGGKAGSRRSFNRLTKCSNAIKTTAKCPSSYVITR
jgi:hypothetical protein